MKRTMIARFIVAANG